MLQKSTFDNATDKSDLVSFKLEDIPLQVENNEVADVIVSLDYIDGLNPREFKNVVPIANAIEDYLTNYPNSPNDFFEIINRNLTEELLSDYNLGLSRVLESLSINLDVAPKVIVFPFEHTNTRTADGDIDDIVSFELEDIPLDLTNQENADVTITLDYIDGIDASGFKQVGFIADRVEDYLTNYPNSPNDFFEVINRNLTTELLNDSNLGLSEVLDSLSVNLDVAPAIIPFQFDSTTTRTPNGDLNDLVSFQLEDVTSPIDGGIVTDITVNLDYIDGIDSSLLKDVIPIGNYIKDFLGNYPVEAGFYEVLNRDLTQGLLNDRDLGLLEVLDSLSVNLDVEPKIIPFQFDSTVISTDSGELNDVVSFQLEDIFLPIDGASIADVAVNLDYIDGIDSSLLKDVIPIGNYIEDYLTNYANSDDSFEVVNNNLGNTLLNDDELGLSEVLDSLTVTLDVSPGAIPFPFENTATFTPTETTNSKASVNFTPVGSQLDNDSIPDIYLNPGDSFEANFVLDTSGLDANLQYLAIRVDQDFSEADFAFAQTDFDATTFPEFNAPLSELMDARNNGSFFSGIFERKGDPGALPDEINIIVSGEITAGDNLINDGERDIGVTVVQAIDANGKDVTELFEPLSQGLDIQPFPMVGIGVEPSFSVEGRESLTLKFNLTEPAPPGGLVVETLVTDADGQDDVTTSLEQAQNIVDAKQILEDGRSIIKYTIAEGATEASIDFTAFEDDLVEGNETFSVTLLNGDDYNLDRNNSITISALVDDNIVVEGTAEEDLLNGTAEADAIFGDRGDDVIFGNDGEDALFGEAGRDFLVGADGNDFLDGNKGGDRLLGDAGEDTLIGGNGQDTLIGGHDNDLLSGGNGKDRIVGVELNSVNPGLGEQDTLSGGSDANTFVLGNEVGIFYDDDDSFASGDTDFARIIDLDIQKDKIQLFGFAEQYSLDFLSHSNGSIDAKLIYDAGLNSGRELVALLENVSPDLSVDDAVFTFV
ncbi:MAG: calcium-binding protein [Xenococcaceae cyanobacterium MO_188.B29]|nr:calcium-binding protein [Xenococcaceae cyanobacterium MO_188.B29]